MFKITLIFLFLLTSIFAQERKEYPFIGVTVSTQSTNIKDADNKRDTTFGIRYGKQTLDWRTMFTYEYKKNGFQAASIEIDKILLDEILGMPEFRPYVGASLGALFYDDNLLSDTNGIYYGANLGLLVYVTDNVDADFSYHYHFVDKLENIDKIKGGTFSLHYFY